MSDIFISYKREEQATARKLADALESEGWSVWWDPKLRAGEHFDDVIEKALNETKCVVVMWSERSVQSRYVRDEATYALDRNKLVPVAIENVNLPFRFRGVHTLRLLDWDGSRDFSEFRRLVDDISTILGPSRTAVMAAEERSRLKTEERHKVKEERPREQEEQRSEEKARRKTDEADRSRIEQELPHSWRTYGPVVVVMVALLVIFNFVFWWPKPKETPIREPGGQQETIEEAPIIEPQAPPKEVAASAPEKKPRPQKEIVRQLPVVKLQSEKQITVTPRNMVEAPKGVLSQAPAEHKQEEAIRSDDKSAQREDSVREYESKLKRIEERIKEGPEMVVIPAGSFQMGDIQGGGDKDEVPVRTVKIQKAFAISRYEVTFEEYDRFATATGRQLPHDEGWGRDRRPVINVSWQDAVEYAKWLPGQTGKRYRLPTEAEWEYAARAGTMTVYWWGNEMRSGMANCDGCGSQWDNKQTSPVGSFKPNPLGLYDKAGNVWEWVEDCWHNNYNGAPTNGSSWRKENDGDCSQRVIRGGSWLDGVVVLRVSNRGSTKADIGSSLIGFRLAHDIIFDLRPFQAPLRSDK
jgi:formylglycine-generating enzyme required for sulfatase activity